MKKLLIAPLLFLCVAVFGQSFSVKGTVRDKRTNKPIHGAIVQKVGSDNSINAVKTDSIGNYSFDSIYNYIKPNTSYYISADARDLLYLASPVKTLITTNGLTTSKVFTCDFALDKLTCMPGFPRVVFDFMKTNVTGNIADSLSYLIKFLYDNPTIVIQFDGYSAPNEGNSKAKMKLSMARSQSCKDYLVSKGIDSAKVRTKGWGDTQTLPGCSADDIMKMKTKEEKEVAYARDRRVEFRVVSFTYKPKN